MIIIEMKRSDKIVPNIWLLLMLVPYLFILNVTLFAIYEEIALFLMCAIVIQGAFHINFRSKELILVFLTGIYMASSVLITGGGFGSVFTFVISMILLMIVSNLELEYKQKEVVRTVSIICICVLFLYSFPYRANYYLYTITHVNPNTCGQFLMYAYMLYLCTSASKAKPVSLFQILLLIITSYGIYNYAFRGGLMAIGAFLLLQFMPVKKVAPNIFFALIITIILLGIIFPFVYLHLYKQGINFSILEKSLYTGRETIWLNMELALHQNPQGYLFGLGSKAQLWNRGSLNVHNNYFAIIVNFGIIGLLLFWSFISIYLKRACAKASDNYECRIWLYMFISSVLVLGFTESTSFWGANLFFAYFSLGMANRAHARTSGGE